MVIGKKAERVGEGRWNLCARKWVGEEIELGRELIEACKDPVRRW